MTLQEIKQAVDEGKTVYAGGMLYQIIKDHKTGRYLVKGPNQSYIGLEWPDGKGVNVTLAGCYIDDEAST